MSSGTAKVRLDDAYIDTRGTNVYWRDPKSKTGRPADSSKENEKKNANDNLPMMWDYQYGKKSSGKNRVKAADLYENWMDDPNALPPEMKKPMQRENEERPKKKKPTSKYATEPHKPKSNYRFFEDYRKDAPDDDSDDEKRKRAKNDETDHGTEDHDSDENDARENEEENEEEEGEEERKRREEEEENEEKEKEEEEEENQDDVGENDNHENPVDQKEEEPPDEEEATEGGTNQLDDLEEITEASPEDVPDENDENREPQKNPEEDSLSNSQGGLPPSPAKRVRKMQRRKTKTNFEDELTAANLMDEAAEDDPIASRGRKPSRKNSNKKPRDRKKSSASGENPPGFIPGPGPMLGRSDDLDIKMRNRDRNRDSRGKTKKDKKSKDHAGGRTPRASSDTRRSPRDGHGSWLNPNKNDKPRPSSTSRIKPKNRDPSPSPRREVTGPKNPEPKLPGGKKNKASKGRPMWKPWSNKGKDFGKKAFIDEDD